MNVKESVFRLAELRLDPTSGEWIIMAPERGGRPSDFKAHPEIRTIPSYTGDCPFCPGNEKFTPPEVAVYRKDFDASRWQVRIIPNKFPALSQVGVAEERLVDGYLAMDGVGYHEVVIESPIHSQRISDMEPPDFELILKAYMDRVKFFSGKEHIESVVIFKNQGSAAGTSITHPHSQIIAIPIVTNQMRRRLQVATEYYGKVGRCLYCDIKRWEHDLKRRIIYESNCFTVFNPYASHHPYETWILPIRHSPCFSSIDQEEVRELSEVLPDTLKRIENILGNPDYNYVLHTTLMDGDDSKPLHWYIQIVPRIWVMGGFEVGSGTYINTVLPEEAARLIRESRQTHPST
ncbi:MAG: galactose-1-phosphate uridylyltransferase [Candidatus Bathyarchaeia archaeon]